MTDINLADGDMTDWERRLLGCRMVTAEIIYRLPDHPGVLQSFVWQQLDQVPRYPRLGRFLAFWERNLDGRLHSVRVAAARIVRPSELRHVQTRLVLQ